jgi:hypothetical protein
MTIVMGLDQHRAQITAEWLDTETGEVTRSRISPAHRQAERPRAPDRPHPPRPRTPRIAPGHHDNKHQRVLVASNVLHR